MLDIKPAVDLKSKFDLNLGNHDLFIQAELVKMLYQQTRTVLLGLIATATIVSIIYYNEIPNRYNFTWIIVVYCLTFVRFVSYKQFKSQERDPVETVKWGWIFVFFAFLSGCTWGAAGIVFFEPQSMQLYIILTLIIIGMTITSMAALSAFLWSYYAYAIPAMLPLVWQYIKLDDQAYFIFGILILVFILTLFPFARVNHRTLRQSIILRFENIDLIEQLTEQKEKAEQANIAKTKFLAAASHDLRQPLHAIGLFLGALEKRVEKEDEKLIVQKIQKSSSALNNLLDSLLDVSKLDAGIVHAKFKPFCMQNLFDALKNECEPHAKEKDLRLKFIHTKLCVNSDYRIMERIIRNLISNAIRYTKKGRIVVGCRRHQGQVLLAVYDTGIGIESEQIDEIFQEFHQLHNPERDRSKGLGLGLAIVKRMAELLNAPLITRSIPDKGSMFGVVIPRVSIAEPIEIITSSLRSTASMLFDNKLVLVVDDEIEIRESLTELLTSWHCEVIACASGKEAVSALSSGGVSAGMKPDIILADYRLRDNETGNEVINKIQALFADTKIPAIIITGDTAPDRIKEASASGYEILHKPVLANTLRLLLGDILLTPSSSYLDNTVLHKT